MNAALLHGFLGDPSVWSGITSGLAIALPGHGAPVLPTWAQNLDAIAHQVRDRDVAIGYSLGARVALGLLAMGAVPRAILISVNPGIEDVRDVDAAGAGEAPSAGDVAGVRDASSAHDAGSERAARRTSDRVWAARFRAEPLAAVLDAWEAQPLFASQSRVAADVLRARRARRLAHDPEQLARSLEVMGLAEMPDHRAIIAPGTCTLIAGADDAKYLALARTLDAPLRVIDHCGHDPLLEQPAALAKVLASLS